MTQWSLGATFICRVAQLVDSTSIATHQEHQEATITALNTPAINYADGFTSQVYTGRQQSKWGNRSVFQWLSRRERARSSRSADFLTTRS